MLGYSQYKDVVFNVIGAAMEVHSSLGKGLLEPLYNEALSLELKARGVNCKREQEVRCYYKGTLLDKKYRMDLMVDDVCVELKSANKLTSGHRAQLFNYLRLTGLKVGLLINFGQDSLHGERYGYSEELDEYQLLDKNMEFVFEPVHWDSDCVEEQNN